MTTNVEIAFKELERVYKECSVKGWDGYDGEPITEENYILAKKFIQWLLDKEMIIEDVVSDLITPSPNGCFSFEWSNGRKTLSVSVEHVNDNGHITDYLTFACLLGTEDESIPYKDRDHLHGRLSWHTENLTYLRSLIQKVTV